MTETTGDTFSGRTKSESVCFTFGEGTLNESRKELERTPLTFEFYLPLEQSHSFSSVLFRDISRLPDGSIFGICSLETRTREPGNRVSIECCSFPSFEFCSFLRCLYLSHSRQKMSAIRKK